jgi:RNA polymerase sigma-70 factor (ECF subfamily)
MESSIQLLARAQGGDDTALNDLLARYLPRLRKWASGRLPGTARGLLDTEDVVQETVVKALRRLDTMEIRGDGALQAYLRQALANRFTDLYRHHRRAPDVGLAGSDLPAPDPSPLEQTIGSEAAERYEAALGRLKADDREAVILRVEMDCDYDEIARALTKQSAASARMAVSRALSGLALEMRHVR